MLPDICLENAKKHPIHNIEGNHEDSDHWVVPNLFTQKVSYV